MKCNVLWSTKLSPTTPLNLCAQASLTAHITSACHLINLYSLLLILASWADMLQFEPGRIIYPDPLPILNRICQKFRSTLPCADMRNTCHIALRHQCVKGVSQQAEANNIMSTQVIGHRLCFPVFDWGFSNMQLGLQFLSTDDNFKFTWLACCNRNESCPACRSYSIKRQKMPRRCLIAHPMPTNSSYMVSSSKAL